MIQVPAVATISRASAGSATSCHTDSADTTKDAAIAPHATAPDTALAETAADAGVQQESEKRQERDEQQHHGIRPRKHEDTKTTSVLCSRFRAFVAKVATISSS